MSRLRTVGLLAIISLAPLGALQVFADSQTAGNPTPVERGKAVFEKCAACHALDDTNGDGPALKGVFGRKAGSRDDFRYSAAMTRSGIVWTAETLDAYLADPQGYVRGNRMSFAGIGDKSDRDDLIAYLQLATKQKE